MHILVVEDNAATARSIELILKAEGHNVSVTGSGEEAIELVALYDYDAVLLDIELEDITGAEALREIRLRKIGAPVIMLTGSADVDTKVAALAAGADDYMTKPFHKAELAARINAVVRRSRGHTESIIRTGPIALNLNTRTAEVNGIAIHLTPSEYKMLELLSLRKNTVLTKEQCLNHLYNGMSEPEIKIIDVFICKLRKKIAAASGGDSHIETVWGGGYMLRDAKPERLAEGPAVASRCGTAAAGRHR
jgi:two-component system, cell cycle response regulator CtrA